MTALDNLREVLADGANGQHAAQSAAANRLLVSLADPQTLERLARAIYRANDEDFASRNPSNDGGAPGSGVDLYWSQWVPEAQAVLETLASLALGGAA